MAYTPIYTPKNFTDWGPPDLDASNLNDIEAALVSLGNGLQTAAADTDTNTTDISTLNADIANIDGDISNIEDIFAIMAASDVVTVDAAQAPAKALIVNMEPKQASGTPSPQNELPISGRSQVKITRTGKNIYFGSPSFDGYTNGNSYTLAGETYNGHAVYYKTGSWGGAYKSITLNKGTYTFSAMVKCSSSATVSLYDTINGVSTQLAVATVGTSWQKLSATFNVDEQRITELRVNLQAGGVTIYISEYQLEHNSTATDYEVYNGVDHTIPFGQTVYGSAFNATTGVLPLDWVRMDIDPSTSFAGTSTGGLSWHDFTVNAVDGFGMSNKLQYISDGNAAWLSTTPCFTINSDGKIRIYANPATFPTDYADTYIVYKAATPATVQLTPTQIDMLKGINNVFVDDGTSDLTYIPESVLPTPPTTDGTYNLKCVVNNGAVSFEWGV